MQTKLGEGERCPLLLLYMEEEDREIKNPERQDRSRIHDLTQGAATVITKWPSHIAACWSGALTFGLILIFIALLTIALTVETNRMPTQYKRSCFTFKPEKMYNNTLSKMYLVHTTPYWTKEQMAVLKSLANHYKDYQINLINIKNCSLADNSTINSNSTVDKNIEEELQKLYSGKVNINLTETNCNAYFKNTPLEDCWFNLKHDVLDFTARALALWQYGGVSFSLENYKKRNVSNLDDLAKIKKLIMPSDLDTLFRKISIDDLTTLKSVLLDKFANERTKRDVSKNNLTHPTGIKEDSLNVTEITLTTKPFSQILDENWLQGDLKNIVRKEIDTVDSNGVHANYSTISFENVEDLFPNFDSISDGSANVDANGIYMATKTTCHAFFEQAILAAHRDNNKSVSQLIRDALRIFCKRGDHSNKICDSK